MYIGSSAGHEHRSGRMLNSNYFVYDIHAVRTEPVPPRQSHCIFTQYTVIGQELLLLQLDK